MPRPPRLAALLALPLLAGAALTGCWGDDGGPGAIEVVDATVDVPANPDIGAVRMVVRNGTDVDDELVGASSPAAESAHLHRSGTDAEGRSTMSVVEPLAIPAGGEARFEAGDLHVMLDGLREPLEAGDTVPLHLLFAEAGTVTVDVRVVEPGSVAEPGEAPDAG